MWCCVSLLDEISCLPPWFLQSLFPPVDNRLSKKSESSKYNLSAEQLMWLTSTHLSTPSNAQAKQNLCKSERGKVFQYSYFIELWGFQPNFLWYETSVTSDGQGQAAPPPDRQPTQEMAMWKPRPLVAGARLLDGTVPTCGAWAVQGRSQAQEVSWGRSGHRCARPSGPEGWVRIGAQLRQARPGTCSSSSTSAKQPV